MFDHSSQNLNVEQAVLDRYEKGAVRREAALCCPVEYDRKYLEVIPQEIIERDYGCGDPSRHIREGDTVLDLGSGGGKICYIAAQIVGPAGRVIGVDMNEEMLALAERHREAIGSRLGYENVEFKRGKIQDLRLDLAAVDRYLKEHPVRSVADWQALEEYSENLRTHQPMIADDSVDVVVSNCVLNLVRERDKQLLVREVFRVLKRGGRAAISDIVSDEDVPEHLKSNPELWSGCISGAFREDALLKAFEEAGFYGMHIAKRDAKPWQTIEGIEFRAVTVLAYKGKEGPCLERNQAVMYKGPWKAVIDDDGHTLFRGERMAVCDKTYRLYTDGTGPYGDDIVGIEPLETVPLKEAKPFDCRKNARRHPRETKGLDYSATETRDDEGCGPNCC
jgi:ubiquinone/menaquinone biosynthesis C-methylase UbiE